MDLSAPTTPQQVLTYIAQEHRARAEKARRDADRAATVAETWEQAAWDAEALARQYEQWQPKPTEETP